MFNYEMIFNMWMAFLGGIILMLCMLFFMFLWKKF